VAKERQAVEIEEDRLGLQQLQAAVDKQKVS